MNIYDLFGYVQGRKEGATIKAKIIWHDDHSYVVINKEGDKIAYVTDADIGYLPIIDMTDYSLAVSGDVFSNPEKVNKVPYKGYIIEYNFYGNKEWTILYNGDDLYYTSLKEAMKDADTL